MKRIVIVGAGAAGYFTAAAIKRNNPNFDVVVVYDPNTPIIGVGESINWTAPFFMHTVLGLTDDQWVKKARSIFKIGTVYQDWNNTTNPFIATSAFNADVDILDTYTPGNIAECVVNSFPQQTYSTTDLWRHLVTKGLLPNDPDNSYLSYSSENYWLVDKNKLPIRKGQLWPTLKNTRSRYSYHINAPIVGQVVHDLVGVPAGVRTIPMKLRNVVLTSTGNIDYLLLDNEEQVTADLFIDCSGFAKVLAQHLPFEFDKLDEYFNDTAIVGPYSYQQPSERRSHAYIRAMDWGWHFSVSMDTRSGEGYVFNSRHGKNVDHLIEEYYTKTGKTDVNFRKISWQPGYQKNLFVNNCITIGLSQGFGDAFDANAFSNTMEQITEMVKLLKADPELVFEWKDHFNHFAKVRNDDIVFRIQSAFHLAPRNNTEYWQELKIAERKFKTREKFLNAINDPKRRFLSNLKDSFYNQGALITMASHYGIPNDFTIDVDAKVEKLAVVYFNELRQYFQNLADTGVKSEKLYTSWYAK
jgi:Tryptophan halogenase